MSGKKKSKWIYGQTDEGSYVSCSKCNAKISAKRILFADEPYTICPNCKSKMEEIDDEILENLRVSAL